MSTVIEIELQEDDAVRAQNDVVFATKIMKTALQQQQEKLIDSNPGESIIVDPPSADPKSQGEEITNTDVEDSGSLYRWSEPYVLFLLENYRQFEEKFSDGKNSHKKIWDHIAKIMNNKGHAVTGPQCAAKLRSLKKTYKAIKNHNKATQEIQSGNNRRTWQFFTIMDDIFSKKAWCTPIATASSTGLSTHSKDSSVIEIDSAHDEPLTSKSKLTTTSLLVKRLRQKEEHENFRNERHKERMEMDNKLLELFTKLVEKQ